MYRIYLQQLGSSNKESADKPNKDEQIWTAETLLAHIFSKIQLNMDIINSERYFDDLWDLWDEIRTIAIVDREYSVALAKNTIKGFLR